MNGARESPCIKIYTGHFTSDNKPDGIENATHNTFALLTRILFFFYFKNVKHSFLYTILLLGFISTQCLIDITPITV
jgi:hypothetical protein